MIKFPFYVISDTHFGHKNIVKYFDRPKYHEELMIAHWRKKVKENDVILHLGDLMMGGDEYFHYFKSEVAPKLTGKKYIILGNHDKRKYDYDKLGFEVVKPFKMEYRQYEISFDHYPKLFKSEDELKIHVHGHIHNHDYSRNEPTRWGNVNVSVEVINYKPRNIARLLNKTITRDRSLLKSKGLTYYRKRTVNQ